MSLCPAVIILISGKRKSGKDYVAEILRKKFETLNLKTEILHLSGPLKKEYAKIHNLDYDQLLNSSNYKEIYRKEMVVWGENIRNESPGYFCNLAIQEKIEKNAKIWIISDCRRLSDVDWFCKQYSSDIFVLKVRVETCENSRKVRGWEFEPGIDDAVTECGLDFGVNWDFVIKNNLQDTVSFDKCMADVMNAVVEKVK